jgi:SAM-dependent methyltransferase
MLGDGSRRPVPGWLLDEGRERGSRENLDAAHVVRDTARKTPPPQMNALLRRPGLTKKSTVVDIGAGTGQFTLAVAPVCARVIAVDVSPVMLDLLRGKVGRRHSTTSTSSTPAFYGSPDVSVGHRFGSGGQ